MTNKFVKVNLDLIDWLQELPKHGISSQYLGKKHGPCPIEREGKDRFRWDNKKGLFHCNNCGSGNAIKFISLMKGISIKDALSMFHGDEKEGKSAAEMRAIINGDSKEKPVVIPMLKSVPKPADKTWLKTKLQVLWDASVPIEGTPVELYLKRRVFGLDVQSVAGSIRYHPAAEYWSEGKFLCTLPAMIARAVAPDGTPITLHRTYLTMDGYKAPVDGEKKQMSSHLPLAGAAIHLNKSTSDSKMLIVCEGIETGYALAASTANRHEVWSLLNCGNLAKADIPKRFTKVLIAADHDSPDNKGFRPGEHHAEILATKLRASGFEVIVRVPKDEGIDFCDLWEQKSKPKLVAVG